MNDRLDTCMSCRFYNPRAGHPYGQCRRRAPSVSREDLPKANNARWPVVTGDDWCGDFEVKRSEA